MLIRYLTIDGVGPFGSRYEIDFDSLTSSGTFLLEGPTGAGKSSIIDAIVFALYGGVAGNDSDAARIRSTHAHPSQPSEVTLVFTVASGTYRVSRTPAWDKPKRGGGTTSVSAKASLTRLSETAIEERAWDKGEGLASGSRDVNTALTDILTLTKNQFVQTVVLPQGQFADFLRMKSEARSRLLETLFGTVDYRDLAKHLAEASANASATVAKAQTALSSAFDVWLSNSATEPYHEAIHQLREGLLDPADERIYEAMLMAGEELTATAASLAQDAATAEDSVTKAQARLASEESLERAIKTKAELEAERAQLEERSSNIESNRQALKRHSIAIVPAQMIAARDKSHAAVADVLTDVPAELDDLSATLADVASVSDESIRSHIETITSVMADLSRDSSELSGQVATLRELADLEHTLTARAQDITALDESIATISAARDQAQQELDGLPEQRAALESEREATAKLIETIPRLEANMDKIAEHKALLAELDKAQATLSRAEKEQRVAIDAAQEANDTHQSVTARWIRSQAAHLATTLSSDEPCPVCGSTTHPAPAEPTDDFASRADVDAALAVLERAKNAVAKAGEKTAKASSLVTHLSERTADVGDIQSREQQATDALDSALAAQARQSDLTAQLDSLAKRSSQLAGIVAESQTQLAEASARRENAVQLRDETLAKVTAGRGDYESIDARLADVRVEMNRVDSTRTVCSEFADTLKRVLERRDDARVAISESSLSSEEILASIMEQEDVERTEKAIRSFDSAWQRVTDRLSDEAIASLTGEEKPDVESARTALLEIKEKAAEVTRASTLATKAAKDASRAVRSVHAAQEAWQEASAEAGPILRLARLANADAESQTRISLPVWVLLRRFEVVIERANEYLSHFSKDRYSLERSDEGNKERKFGLGLEVIDRQGSVDGEERRPTGTLSGGETFYASLALALGLAETVQEESGGVRIDTLLIDEGFGTLSPDVLDAVMDTLNSLAIQGRKVGIISHVEELKRIVSNRLTITPLRSGGSKIDVVS